MSKLNIFMTGATGSMGFSTLLLFLEKNSIFNLSLLVRPSKKNRKKLRFLRSYPNVKIIWGDLLDKDKISEGVSEANMILHLGAVIPPFSDQHPEVALKTNINSMKYIIESVKESNDPHNKAVVYIGSISQYGDRKPPVHWARTGDPISVSYGDAYSLSKAIAERMLADSGLKKWVAIRQTGMLCKEMLQKGTDPLTFHVPLDSVLEWSTVDDSARYMVNLCSTTLPDSFWRKFYNLGSGESYRLTNTEFIEKILKSLSCPPPEKIFETKWFAKKNFHGVWYSDSDKLENLIPSRSGLDCNQFMEQISKETPFYFSLAKIVPPFVIKMFMGKIAHHPLAPLSWTGQKFLETFGSVNDLEMTPDWEYFKTLHPDKTTSDLYHGYDSNKPDEEIDAADLKAVAEFRGGKCLSLNRYVKGDLFTLMDWECCCGHKFQSAPNTILRGGHWCEECLRTNDKETEAKKNLFLAQIL